MKNFWNNIRKGGVWTIVFIIFILVTYLFIHLEWNYWNFKHRINVEKFSAYGQITASLLTALTVYLLFRQNKQQLEEATKSSLPDLYPASVLLDRSDEIHKLKNHEVFLPKFEISRTKLEVSAPSQNAYIQIHNIGLGAAKEIEVNWIYNDKEVIEYVGEIYPLGEMSNNDYFFDFIPASSKDEILLPQFYLMCYGIRSERKNVDRPVLKLKIEFKDIYNNRYFKEFSVDIKTINFLVYVRFKQIQNKYN